MVLGAPAVRVEGPVFETRLCTQTLDQSVWIRSSKFPRAKSVAKRTMAHKEVPILKTF